MTLAQFLKTHHSPNAIVIPARTERARGRSGAPAGVMEAGELFPGLWNDGDDGDKNDGSW